MFAGISEGKELVARKMRFDQVYISPKDLVNLCSISYHKTHFVTTGFLFTEFAGVVETPFRLQNGRPVPLIVLLERVEPDHPSIEFGVLHLYLLRNISKLIFPPSFKRNVLVEGSYPVPSNRFANFVSEVKIKYFD